MMIAVGSKHHHPDSTGHHDRQAAWEEQTDFACPPDWKLRTARWWCVLRFHRVSQLVHRLAKHIRYATWDWIPRAKRLDGPPPAVRENSALRRLLDRHISGRLSEDASRTVDEILGGCYELLHQERQLGHPCEWHSNQVSRAPALWRFHLHYQEYLLDFAVKSSNMNDPRPTEQAWLLVCRWIEQNPPRDRRVLADAWHPFCISRRLGVWIALWQSSPPPNVEQRELVLGSLVRQAAFLERNLEWDLGGNHLLENAKALVLAGSFVAGRNAERWLRRGIRILQRELSKQILPHGEHFERSPGYHAQTLHGLLDVQDALRDIRPDAGTAIGEYISRMAGFLEAILHPDDEIPLFGDSCISTVLPPRCLIAEAAKAALPGRTSGAIQDPGPANWEGGICRGDYWIWRAGTDFFVLDAAPVGADHLPAHAHSDLLTFEASIGGRRLFVDSGVFCYEESPMRRYCRSTKAHNVVQVDEVEQCDAWSSFRMGRRGWPGSLESGTRDGFSWALAEHNAYRHLGIPRVRRWVGCRTGGPWFCVDRVEGSGRHRVSLRLHLHPDVVAEASADGAMRLALGDSEFELRFLAPGCISVQDAWYCPEIGRRIPSRVVVWSSETAIPVTCGWSLAWGDVFGTASLETDVSGKTTLIWDERAVRTSLPALNGSAIVTAMHRRP